MNDVKEKRSSYASEGREFFPAWEPLCSPDGNFGKVQHRADSYDIKYCSDRDGELIEDFWVSLATWYTIRARSVIFAGDIFSAGKLAKIGKNVQY